MNPAPPVEYFVAIHNPERFLLGNIRDHVCDISAPVMRLRANGVSAFTEASEVFDLARKWRPYAPRGVVMIPMERVVKDGATHDYVLDVR